MSTGTSSDRLIQNNDQLDLNNDDLESLKALIHSLPDSVRSYLLLDDKPSINNVRLENNKTLQELGIQPIGNYETRALTNLEIDEIMK